MQSSPQKNSRSEQARINGAKSRGPNTPAGKRRAQTAPLQHGLFAVEPNLLPTVDEPAYAAFRQTYLDEWGPANQYMTGKVDDLVAYRWELNRLRAVRRQFLARIFADVTATFNPEIEGISVVVETEIRATTQSETLDRFDLRIRRNNLEISRIERDFIRVQRYFGLPVASQISLKTKEPEPNRTQAPPIAWVEDTFDIALDLHQAELVAATEKRVILNAARYSGKTTALAFRAIHESIENPNAEIVCLSPNSDLLDKIAETAAIVNHNPSNITGNLTETATLILVDDAASLPMDALKNIGETVTIILAGTPNGASGYFYEQWCSPQWRKIFAPANRCDLIDETLKNLAAAKLSESAYLQEFQCQFLSAAQPRCRLLPLAQ